MGQGERIEILTHCPLTPSLKKSLKLQGIKKRLDLHFRPNSILGTVSLALILIVSGLVIFWMLVPVEDWIDPMSDRLHGTFILDGITLFGFASIMWVLVITVLAGLSVSKLRPNSLNPPTLVTVSLALILMASGVVILWMLILVQLPGISFLESLQLIGVDSFIGFVVYLVVPLLGFWTDIAFRNKRIQQNKNNFNTSRRGENR